jgi:hypothetical protein
MESEDELVEYLRQKRQTWTERAVAELAADPAGLKSEASICQGCTRPCQDDEICVSAVVHEQELLDRMGQDQAFHLIEGGTNRLMWREEVALREEDTTRPNTFVELLDET